MMASDGCSATQDVLAQVHIPKCAGTAIHNWMRFSRETGLTSGFAGFYGADLLDERLLWSAGLHDRRVTTISAHNIRKFPATVRARPIHYFTILRDPQAQLLSTIRYAIQRRAKSTIPHHVGNTVKDVATWLYRDSRQFDLECAQTNHLALHTWCASAPERCEPSTYGDWRPDDRAAYRRDRLAVAKSILDTFLAVGVVERLDATVEVVRYRAAHHGIHLLPSSAVPVVNVTDAAIDTDKSWIADGWADAPQLDGLADDEALYAYGTALLEAAAAVTPTIPRSRQAYG